MTITSNTKTSRPFLVYFIVGFLFVGVQTRAQSNYANNWYFGNYAAIIFGSTPYALTNSAMHSSEGCASISDKATGQLLFYTNGEKIWNRNHVPFPDSLFGNMSSTQSSLIIPKPDSSNVYYVFSTDAIEDTLKNGLRYSIVDISLNAGLGGIRPNYKNIPLLTASTEKLTGTRHKNGIDYWLVAHEWGTDAYYSYLITKNGISSSPVITHIGLVYNGVIQKSAGYLRISPNSSKLVNLLMYNGINDGVCEVLDFDNSTGIVSNLVTINGLPKPYCATFSPNSKILYVTENYNKELFQYNLSAGNSNAIIASKTLIGSDIKAVQLSSNKKIYVGGFGNPYLGVINTPDSVGINCGLITNSISLNGKTISFGLPNYLDCWMLDSATYAVPNGIKDYSLPNNKTVFECYPNPFSNNAKLVFNTPCECRAIIEIYSVNGELIETVLNQLVDKQAAYEVNYDASNLQSGIYFYKFKAGENSVYKKVVITK